ncbi:MAG: methionyl-tRNA formyltransferase [Tenacibaculum sp.]
MKNLRIVFMGTPDFALTVLKSLVENKYPIVGVITSADKPAGRGRVLRQSPVKKYALYKNLPLLQPTNLKDKEFQNSLRAWNANLQIVVAFRMLPKSVWDMPAYGTFNLHASLLPQYRGAAPINWAIINGETKTGVTTFFIDDQIDTGEIILQKQTNIGKDETFGQLYNRLMSMGANLVVQTIELISKANVKTTKQAIADTNMHNKQAPKLFCENCKIDWSKSLSDIYNKIRGLNPQPGAWTTILNKDKKITAKLYSVDKEFLPHKFNSGKIITTKYVIKIAVKDGFLIVNQLKLSGKKLMDAKSLLNGFEFSSEAKVI